MATRRRGRRKPIGFASDDTGPDSEESSDEDKTDTGTDSTAEPDENRVGRWRRAFGFGDDSKEKELKADERFAPPPPPATRAKSPSGADERFAPKGPPPPPPPPGSIPKVPVAVPSSIPKIPASSPASVPRMPLAAPPPPSRPPVPPSAPYRPPSEPEPEPSVIVDDLETPAQPPHLGEMRAAHASLLEWPTMAGADVDPSPRFGDELSTEAEVDLATVAAHRPQAFAPNLAMTPEDAALAAENAAFEDLLDRYAQDFDDEAVRVSLELMADNLHRWSDLVVAAKRQLARHSGTPNEDRIWGHISMWSERAQAAESPATSRSGRLPTTAFVAPAARVPEEFAPPAPDSGDEITELPDSAAELHSVEEIEAVSIDLLAESARHEDHTELADEDLLAESVDLASLQPLSVRPPDSPATRADMEVPSAETRAFSPSEEVSTTEGGATKTDRPPDSGPTRSDIAIAPMSTLTSANHPAPTADPQDEAAHSAHTRADHPIASTLTSLGVEPPSVVNRFRAARPDVTIPDRGSRTTESPSGPHSSKTVVAATLTQAPESVPIPPAPTSSETQITADARDTATRVPAAAWGDPPPASESSDALISLTDEDEAAAESRTMFLPMAAETEMTLEADDLVEDEDDDLTKPGNKPMRRPAAEILNRPSARAEERARQKKKSAPPPPPPPPPPEEPAPPSLVDPIYLETAELDGALARAKTDIERARVLAERGRREMRDGMRDKAIDTFRDALTFEPSNRDALEALEQAYREAKNTTRLIEVLEQKLELSKSDALRAEGLIAIAELYEKELRDLPEAINRLSAAHALQPKNTKALLALARCHHALGDIGEEVEALKKILKGEMSRAEKLELLLKIAALQENSLSDYEGAIDTYQEIVADHPQHKQAFNDLARLSDLSGSWKARALILEHQTELSKEPRRQAQLLVELGDLLAHEDRRPHDAKKHYERAARVFPSSPSAWRGLEQLAIWAGDNERAEFCLEQRVRHTPDLAERAAVLIELAHHRAVAMNKQSEGLAAYELAYKADPTNETAAMALLTPFVNQKRYAEAAALCEVLYRAASDRQDNQRMLEILDTSWSIAIAMGNPAQLLSVAAARYRLAPNSDDLRHSLLDAAYDARDNQEALRRARGALDLVRDRTTEGGAALSKLAAVLCSAGDLVAAEGCYERVLSASPTDTAALLFLSEQAENRNDFRRAASLKERLGHEIRDNDERFELLLSAGDLWLRARGHVAAALRAYEEALSVRPRDEILLRTLLGLYTDHQAWDRVAAVQRTLADIETDPERKAKVLTALAVTLEDHMDDAAGASDVLEEALVADPQRLDAFERLTRALTKQKDWSSLADAYRQMLARINEKEDPKLAYALYHQLGLVYRDRVGDAERALKAFTQAATLRPDDLEARKIVTELLVITERLDAAVNVARATLMKDPLDQQLYRDLYELFLREHAYDKAWCVAEAMGVLGPLTDTERQFVEDYPPVEPSEIPASLIATAWPTHIHHAELDRTLTSALQIAVAVYLRARLQQSAPPALSVPLDQDPSPEAARVLASFRNAAEVLACQMPALHGTPVPGPLFSSVLALQPTITISLATSATVSGDLLNFLATKRLAEQQPALRARSLFPSVQELKQLFFTTTQLATASPQQAMMRPGWDGGLGAVMTPEERAGLRGLVAGIASSGQKLDVKRWLQLAEVTAMRAGLLICGSVLTAQRAMGLEPRNPDDLGPQQWLAELGMYASSEQYFELRETIHVAI